MQHVFQNPQTENTIPPIIRELKNIHIKYFFLAKFMRNTLISWNRFTKKVRTISRTGEICSSRWWPPTPPPPPPIKLCPLKSRLCWCSSESKSCMIIMCVILGPTIIMRHYTEPKSSTRYGIEESTKFASTRVKSFQQTFNHAPRR